MLLPKRILLNSTQLATMIFTISSYSSGFTHDIIKRMQYGDEKKEKLNRLERKLYSRNTPNIIDKGRSDFNQSSDQGGIVGIGEENEKIKESWTGSKTGGFDELAAKVSRMANRKNNLVKKIFIFSIISPDKN